MYNRFTFQLLFLLLPFGAWAQDYAGLWSSGTEQLAKGNYSQALQSFSLYNDGRPGDGAVLTGLGICYYHLNNLEKAASFLFESLQSKNDPPADVYHYLGKLFHARLDFEKAIGFYKSFLRHAGKNHPERPAVKRAILYCATGIKVERTARQGEVMNLGAPVNTAADEFKPLPSPNHPSRVYFSSDRNSNAGAATGTDMFFTEITSGRWSQPGPISVFINTVENEVALDFSENGCCLYFFRGKTLHAGVVLVDTFKANAIERTLFSAEFSSPMKPLEGDRDPAFFSDDILLFASGRAGGFGGMDLYYTMRTGNSGWTAPENLGPTVNSPFDEGSPFLARDGRTLYFSTNDPSRSIGGLDIVRSVFLDHTMKWSPPDNLGIPFNAAGDDEHFSVTPDGREAHFASSRKQGLGKRDLYRGVFHKPRAGQSKLSEPIAFCLVEAQDRTTVSQPKVKPLQPVVTDDFSMLEVRPLYYPAPQMPLTDKSFAELKKLGDWMQKFPQLKVTFAVHADPSDDERQVCRAALQQVREYLDQRGVLSENVRFRTAGAKFALPEAAANRRIDVFIANPADLPAVVRYEDIGAPLFFHKANTGFYYHVQLPVDYESLEDELYRVYPEGMDVQYPATGERFFTRGTYLTWFSAAEAKKDMERYGFANATIAPYLNGWEITREEARRFVNRYPDLDNYLKQ